MSRQLYKALPELKALDNFSKDFAKGLFRKRSWWLPQFRIGSGERGHDSGGQPYLEVCLPSPVKSPERDMYIHTDGYRITVYPDVAWHHHLYLKDDGDMGKLIQNTLEYINPLLDETAVIVKVRETTKDGTPYIYTYTIWLDQLDTISDIILIRSWRGTYDRVLQEDENLD